MKSYTTLIERKITVDRQLCRACQVGIGKRDRQCKPSQENVTSLLLTCENEDPALLNPLLFWEKLEIQISIRSFLIFICWQQIQNNFKCSARHTKHTCGRIWPLSHHLYSSNVPNASNTQLYFWVVLKSDMWKVRNPIGNLSLLLL